MREFTKGDKVSWKVHSGEALGTVQAKITSNTEVSGRRVRASDDSPQYLVQDNKNGVSAHKPSELWHAG